MNAPWLENFSSVSDAPLTKDMYQLVFFLTAFIHCSLGRLQDSNAVLSHFNEFSERCYTEVSGDLTRNVRLLKSMKSDLDHIFMKLRCAPQVPLFLLVSDSKNQLVIVPISYYNMKDHCFLLSLFTCRNIKAKLKAAHPDAFPDDSTSKMIDQRPDLETPL